MISSPCSPLGAVKIVKSRRNVSSKMRRFSGSSSTYRIGYSRRSRSISGLGRMPPLARARHREAQHHARARARLRVELEPTAALFDDPPRDREPEPRAAAGLGGDERFEQALAHLGRDAR